MNWIYPAILAALACRAAAADPPDEKITRMECQCEVDKLPAVFPKGESLRGTYHYDVWLPPGYSGSGDRRYPCLFLASPGGEASRMFGPYQEWVKRHEWIVVMLVESRNGVLLPAVANFLGAHDDAAKRFRILDGMKAAAGMSGAARISSLFVQVRKGFTGLFLQGAGFLTAASGRFFIADLSMAPGLSVFQTMGEKDFNGFEVRRLLETLPPEMVYFPRLFDGGHAAPDAALTAEGMDWLSQRMWERAPVTPALRKAAAFAVRDLAAAAEKAAAPAEKHRFLERAGAMVKRCGLAGDSALAPKLAEWSREFAALKQHPDVQREIAAATALAKLRTDFEKALPKFAGEPDPALRKQQWEALAASHQAAAEKHTGTKSGSEAAVWARAFLFDPAPPSPPDGGK